MNLTFDLFGDLNLSPGDQFNWDSKATSLYCLVTGNISADKKTVVKTLNHLSDNYQEVFYIDGMLEHRQNYNTLESNYQTLEEELSKSQDSQS